MPFSNAQKAKFISVIQKSGWRIVEGNITAPSGGLWFSDSHFRHWSPAEMREVFIKRATRIEKAKIRKWEEFVVENREAAAAADEISRDEERS